MRIAKFSIESLSNKVFEGFTKDEDWNGWACPYFTLEEGKKILKAHTDNGVNGRYDEESDSFVFEVLDEEEVYSAILEDDKKLYPIGNSSWIWEDA